MIQLKSPKEIEIMRQGGKILKNTLDKILSAVKPGISLLDLDSMAEKMIKDAGAEASFKRVPNYKWTTCIGVNDVVVHGIPTTYKLKTSDKMGIDCGVYYKGFHTDSAWTILVGDTEDTKHTGSVRVHSPEDTKHTGSVRVHSPCVNELEKKKFLKTGELALKEALAQVRIGNRIGHISKAIQKTIEKEGYSIVKSLTGHGVGQNLHEEPEIPGILRGKIEDTPEIIAGQVLAIEVIYNMGSPDIIYKNDDGWTISTKDAKISGLFEKTVAVKDDGVFLLT